MLSGAATGTTLAKARWPPPKRRGTVMEITDGDPRFAWSPQMTNPTMGTIFRK